MNEHATDQNSNAVRERIIAALRKVFDPELPINIYDLGLIYDIAIADGGAVEVRMTLTTPNCPVAETLPRHVKQQIEAIPGVSAANVQVVFDPPWSTERMSEVAKFELECMGLDPERLHSGLTSLTIGRTPPRPRP